MKSKLLLSITFALLSSAGFSQITIDSSDIVNPGDVIHQFWDTVSHQHIQITPGSANAQSWDYSALEGHILDSLVYVDTSQVPESHRFPDATMAVEYDGFYIMYRKDDVELKVMGELFELSPGNYDDIKYGNGMKLMGFPSSYDSSFTHQVVIADTFDGGGMADEFRVKVIIDLDSRCDAFGDLTTPADHYPNTLRQKIDQVVIDSAWAVMINPDSSRNETLVSSSMNEREIYNWFVNGGKYPVLEVQVEDDSIIAAAFQPGSKPVPRLTVFHNDCYGDEDGEIIIDEVTGGVPPYSYLWSDGSSSASLQNLAAGTYSVTIYSAADSSVTTVEITQPDSIFVNGVVTDESAPGEEDGSVILDSVAGGTFPYSFEWSNGNLSRDLEDAEAGTYTVTVTDFNSCTNEFSFEVGGGVSTGDIASKNDVRPSVYPNPASDHVHIELSGGIDKVEFFSLTGTLVRTESPRGNSAAVLRIGELGPGIYLLKIQSGDEVFIEKLKK